MRAPGFWGRPPGLLAALLSPLAWVWTTVTRIRVARPGERVGVPVLCVGNLTVGGAGKTPTVVCLMGFLAARGIVAHAISRGYGGSLEGPVRVNEQVHTAAEVGDEPLLLAAFGPVWVGKDRTAAARAAVADGAQAVVLDDGFQNPGLVKDLTVLVVDAGYGFGNGRVIPSGPLREPVAEGVARADLALMIGTCGPRERLGGLPVLDGELRPLATGMAWSGLRVLAFAGIGRPGKFFATLRGLGAEIVATHEFPDHAVYHPQILARLRQEALAARAQLVTTEKDAVRLPIGFRREVLVVPVRLEIADTAPLEEALARIGL